MSVIWARVWGAILRAWRRLPFLNPTTTLIESLRLEEPTPQDEEAASALLGSRACTDEEADSPRHTSVATAYEEPGANEGDADRPGSSLSWSSEDGYPGNDEGYWDQEEGTQAYRHNGLHPVFIGDIYNEWYQVLSKLGYGMYSTVWLVRDLKSGPEDKTPYRAMKILCAGAYHDNGSLFEREILKHLRDSSPGTNGWDYICHLLDDFEHQGPNGKHVCLIFEPMGETLRSFTDWFDGNGRLLPGPVAKRFAVQLITAIWYAHYHGVIHTDIKPDNIFVKFQDFSLIEKYLADLPAIEQNREGEYQPIPSIPLKWDYFEMNKRVDFSVFDVCLGDWGVATWEDEHLMDEIQPIRLRAPEVMLEIVDWDESVDWWNFGCVLIQFFRAVCLFPGRHPHTGEYDFAWHLAQIEDQFGPFPKKLLDRGNPELVAALFDEQGRVITARNGTDAERTEEDFPKLEYFMRGYNGVQKNLFLDFMRMLMKIDPEERPDPLDMLGHPWLDAIRRQESEEQTETGSHDEA